MADIRYEIARESLSDQAYRLIKTSILNGTLKAGQRIPELSIADRFGLSRTPIRDALRRLEAYGLIRIKPRSYAEVVSLTPDEAEDVAQLRASLETLAIRQLTARATDADMDALADIARRCDERLESGDVGGAFELDSKFHLEIAQLSGNRHLYEVSERTDAKMHLLRLVLHLPVDKLRFFVAQHREILRAARARDSHEASRLMSNHVLDQLQYYEPKTEQSNPAN